MSSGRILFAAAVAFVLGIVAAFAGMALAHAHFKPAAATSESTPASAQSDTDSDDSVAGVVHLPTQSAHDAGIALGAVRVRLLRASFEAPGTVEAAPDRRLVISPPAEGQVVRVNVALGQQVTVGEPLLTLRSTAVAQDQAAVILAQGQAHRAIAQAQIARTQVALAADSVAAARSGLLRQRALAAAGEYTQSPYAAAQSNQALASADLQRSQSELSVQTTALIRTTELFQDGLVSQAQVDQAKAVEHEAQIAVTQDQTQLRLAQQALRREGSVFSQRLFYRQAVQTASSEAKAAEDRLAQTVAQQRSSGVAAAAAQAQASSAEAALRALCGNAEVGPDGSVTLVAAISGEIGQLDATVGRFVQAGDALMTIDNLAVVTVRAEVPESELSVVHVGQQAAAVSTAYPGSIFTGLVQSLATELDPVTRTLPVRCVVANSAGRLRPGMFVRVAITERSSNSAVVVPTSAIVYDGSTPTVYIAERGGYMSRVVTLGQQIGAETAVQSGLSAGEKLVVRGALTVQAAAAAGSLQDND